MDIINEIKSPESLLDYMNKNIKYGFIGKDDKHYTDSASEEWNDWYSKCIVQNGEEVLKSNIGTCWDQVELERLWFEKHNYSFHTYFMWFELDRENDYPSHTFLIYEKDNKYYWFENAFEAERGIHEFTSIDEAIECVKSKQIKYTKTNFVNASTDDMNSLVVYEYSKPENHLGINDYLNHVTSTKYVIAKRKE